MPEGETDRLLQRIDARLAEVRALEEAGRHEKARDSLFAFVLYGFFKGVVSAIAFTIGLILLTLIILLCCPSVLTRWFPG